MHVLSLDTSTSLASVAVSSDTTLIAESVFTCDRSLSARLVPEIERLLELAGLAINRIDLFAASLGPGSFTGVRCGVATIQGLALATGKPCAGYSSLAMLAMNFSLNRIPVCPLLDARKNEVYAALYDCSGPIPAELFPDCVIRVEHFLDRIKAAGDSPIIFVGEGARRYHETIAAVMRSRARFAYPVLNAGRAAHGALLAFESFQHGTTLLPHQLLPTYIRPSEAEIARSAKF